MLRYHRHNLCYPYRNSLALCLWMVPSELHTWFFLSGERIHMGTHENVFFPYADILILYERAPNKIITYFCDENHAFITKMCFSQYKIHVMEAITCQTLFLK